VPLTPLKDVLYCEIADLWERRYLRRAGGAQTPPDPGCRTESMLKPTATKGGPGHGEGEPKNFEINPYARTPTGTPVPPPGHTHVPAPGHTRPQAVHREELGFHA
jgi:hypothetical protein